LLPIKVSYLKMENKEEKKIYKYNHDCPGCGNALSVTFVPTVINGRSTSIGNCIECGHPAIIGRRGTTRTGKVEWKRER